MATTLVYTITPYVPFTKIRSADINQDKTDIKNRINWAGGTSATTGLGDDNVQSNAASGGGLTRATKLKLGTAYAFISNSVTGAMQDVVSAANQVLYTNASGVPTAGVLSLAAGGTGSIITDTTQGNALQFNVSGAIESAPIPGAAAVKLLIFRNFT